MYVVANNWVNAGVCVQPDYTSCNQAYYNHNSSKTGLTTAKAWTTKTTSAAVSKAGSYGRGHLTVRLDIPWRPDSISDTTVTKGIKY